MGGTGLDTDVSAAKSIQGKAVWAGRNSSFNLCPRVVLREKNKLKFVEEKKRVIREQREGREMAETLNSLAGSCLSTWLVPKLPHFGMGIVHRTDGL